MNRNILVSLPNGTAVREFVITGTCSELLRNSCRLVLMSPFYEDERFLRLFPDGFKDEVRFYRLPVGKLGFLHKKVMLLRALQNYELRPSDTLRIKRKREIKKGPIRTVLKSAVGKIVGFLPEEFFYELFATIRFPEEEWVKSIFARHDIDIVALYQPGYYPSELVLQKVAKTLGVPRICWGATWDNLSGKGPAFMLPSATCVWNPVMKEDAVRYFGFRKENVFVTGAPQFDFYFRDGVLSSKEEFLRKKGFDPSRKLITITLSNIHLFPYNKELIELMVCLKKKYLQKYNPYLLFRLHQMDSFGKYADVQKQYDSEITIEEPGRRVIPGEKDWLPTEEDVIYLANLLKHSDVVVNPCSTINIDASIFDVPLINLCFEPARVGYLSSIRSVSDYTHNRNLIVTGGVWCVYNEDDLGKALLAYLENPNLKEDNRRIIVEKFVYFTDGKSHQRVARAILNFRKQ